MPASRTLLFKICQSYYRDRLTMAQIGARFGLSRHKVGRLLQEAEDLGVVRIEIRPPSVQGAELERKIEAALGLKTCIVAEVESDLSPDEVKQRTGAIGAEFLREILREDSVIGVGWGSTTFELVKQFEPSPLPRATVIQITGGNKRISHLFDCHEVTRRLAEKLGVAPVLLHAPGIVDRKETRELLLKESAVADTFRHFKELELAIVGIGSLVPAESSTLIASGYIGRKEMSALKKAGAVGDVYSYFIDDQGGIVRNELHERLITIGVEDLKRVPTSIGVATGAVKAKAVIAAARGGFVNTLVLESLLARAVLSECEDAGRAVPEVVEMG